MASIGGVVPNRRCRLNAAQLPQTRNHSMSHTTPSSRTIRFHTAVFLACCIAVSSAVASTNFVGGDSTLEYGPPSQFLDRDFFGRGSSGSGVSSGVYNVTVDFNGNYPQVGQINARAGYGSVGVSASTSFELNLLRSLNAGHYENVRASGIATAVFTDVLVTGPGSGNISTRIRLHLSGFLSATSVPSTNTDASVGTANVSFAIYINNNMVGWGNRLRISNNGGAPYTEANGLFAGIGNGGVVTTDFFSVARNTPVTVKLEMRASVQSKMDFNLMGTTSATSQYYHSLGFAADQPVFDLPAGHTANSADGNIVNNSYQPNTNAPVLNINSLSNGVALIWPATNQTTQLEYSTNVSGPWFPVATAPILTNSQHVLTWTNKLNSAFFRLNVP
jgi:hypothetical protein